VITRRNISRLVASLPFFGLAHSAIGHQKTGYALQDILAEANRNPSILALGTSVLRKHDNQVSFKDLESELVQRIGNYQNMDEKELQRVIAEAVRSDFEAGAVVNIDGWRLAKLETVVAAMSTFV